MIAWACARCWLGPCGLVSSAGLLEVATRVLCRAIDPTRRLYLMSKHFVWLTPLASMVLFLGLGLLLAGMTRALAAAGCVAQPQAALCVGDSADAHGRGAADLTGGLVYPGFGDRITVGSVARVATGQTEAVVVGLESSRSVGTGI